ncbi:MAG: Lrp/AsnC family transcriptional regulator [Spirosomataceae bacterium]
MLLDKTDRRILQLLQEDGSLSVKEVAHQIGLSHSPTHDRIKRLRQSGYIRKIVALVDKSKLEQNLMVICLVNLKDQAMETLEHFEREAAKIPEVIELLCVGGSWDYILKIVTRDMNTFHTVTTKKLASINNVANINSNFVMQEVKYETAYPIPT